MRAIKQLSDEKIHIVEEHQIKKRIVAPHYWNIFQFWGALYLLYSPFFLRFIFPTPITGLWPVDFPFKILISGNHTGFQFIHSNHPFFQKIIQNSIVKPHTDRSMGRNMINLSQPAVRAASNDTRNRSISRVRSFKKCSIESFPS